MTLTLLIVLAFPAFGKVNRYMVFLKDKEGNSYSINNPDAFLSQRSLNRRNNQNIRITTEDLPVTEMYIDELSGLVDVRVHFTTKWMNGVLVEMDETSIESVQNLSFVKEVLYIAPGTKLINDQSGGRVAQPDKTDQSEIEFSESGPQNEFIGVDAMHEKGFKGEGMLIAVFDSGFKYVNQSSYFSHLFNEDRVVGTRDFIRNSPDVYQYDTHGSKVISCIGAFKEGEYSGTAPEADYLLCVTEDIDNEYRIEEFNWLFAAEYSDSIGVDVINSSVGYSYFDDERMDYTYEDLNGKTAIISIAATTAASKGLLVVSSNGNEGNSSWLYLNAPADADSILSVGAVNYDRERSSFSSFGPSSDGRIKPDISALGTLAKVVSNEEVTFANGTSFSTPMVAGLAAGLWQAFPELTNMEIMQYLKMTASQSDAPDTIIGYGIPNFINAYNRIKINEGDVVNKFVVFPNPVTNKRIIYFYVEEAGDTEDSNLRFYDLKGSFIRSEELIVENPLNPVEVDVSFLTPGSYILTYMSMDGLKKSKLIVL